MSSRSEKRHADGRARASYGLRQRRPLLERGLVLVAILNTTMPWVHYLYAWVPVEQGSGAAKALFQTAAVTFWINMVLNYPGMVLAAIEHEYNLVRSDFVERWFVSALILCVCGGMWPLSLCCARWA